MSTCIDCRGVDLGYNGRVVVHDLRFEVNEGDLLCVIGENGAGKSTLIKTLLGLQAPVRGAMRFQGVKQSEIGYLPQQTDIQKDFPASVREIVLSGCLNRMGLRPFYSQANRDLAEQTMNRLGIGTLSEHCYRNLSGGQQQRALLARALCATSKMLVLDEPGAGLDPAATAELYEIIRALNREQGITVIMVTHDLHSSVRLATHILHMAHIPLFFGTRDEYVESEIGQTFLKRAAL